MLDLTVRFLAWELSACTARPQGCRRAETAPTLRFTPPPPRFTECLDGGATMLVRPHVLTPDERRSKRERRRALYLATFGLDSGPHYIHGIRVGADR